MLQTQPQRVLELWHTEVEEQRHPVFHGLLGPAPSSFPAFLTSPDNTLRGNTWRSAVLLTLARKWESDSKQSPHLTPTSQTVWSQRSQLNCISQVQNPGSRTEQPETKQGRTRALWSSHTWKPCRASWS